MADTATATPEVKAAPKDTEQSYRVVALEKLEESKTNPRRSFDPKALEDLAASMKEKGIIEPLIVRPVSTGRFEIVAGARRYRAAKKAGLVNAPCILRELNDEQALEVQVIENLQRADVHPLEEADGYQRLLGKGKYDVDAIAAKVGKTTSYVYQRLKLLELIEPAKKAFLDGGFTAGHAVLIARLDKASQKEALDQLAAHNGYGQDQINYLIGVRDLAKWIHREIYLDLKMAPWDKDDKDMLPKAGPCSTCPKRAGNAPTLFSDVQKADTCTDRSCFDAKMAKWIEVKRVALVKEGKKVELISHDYKAKAKGVLGSGKWRQMEKGADPGDCGFLGVVVDGDNVGAVLNICTAGYCKKPGHGVYSLPQRSKGGTSKKSAESERKAAQKEEARKEQERIRDMARAYSREKLLEEILKKTKSLTRADLELVAITGPGLPYLETDPKWMPQELTSPAAAAKASDVDLARFIVASALSHDIGRFGDAVQLEAAAKRHRINIKAIEKEALTRAKNERLHKEQVRRWQGRVASQADKYDKATCAHCGCVEAEACPGGCEWVKLDTKTNVGLCSACKA